jgi:hypothetical protein
MARIAVVLVIYAGYIHWRFFAHVYMIYPTHNFGQTTERKVIIRKISHSSRWDDGRSESSVNVGVVLPVNEKQLCLPRQVHEVHIVEDDGSVNCGVEFAQEIDMSDPQRGFDGMGFDPSCLTNSCRAGNHDTSTVVLRELSICETIVWHRSRDRIVFSEDSGLSTFGEVPDSVSLGLGQLSTRCPNVPRLVGSTCPADVPEGLGEAFAFFLGWWVGSAVEQFPLVVEVETGTGTVVRTRFLRDVIEDCAPFSSVLDFAVESLVVEVPGILD